jgi:hypothetical protein
LRLVRLVGALSLLVPVLASAAPKDTSLERLGDCNWQVTYRGRIYDLSPLTRESLSRPIENDIRYVLQRVPEAGMRLEAMTGHLRDARAHTILASIFISGLLVAKLFEGHASRSNDPAKSAQIRDGFHIGEAAAAGFFLGATFFSWRSSTRAKEELVNAVDEFNLHSPYKMEPASGGLTEPATFGGPGEK